MKEIRMSYKEYKENYYHCFTKPNSYDKREKTIVVFVPKNTEDTFYHYGIKVYVRLSENGIYSDLKEAGIDYIALPLIDNKVVKFNLNGKKVYAYCVMTDIDEKSYERIYITEEIPEDMNWKNIEEDYTNQLHGEECMRLKTRARVLFDEAKSMAYNYVKKQILRKNPEEMWKFPLVKKKDIEYPLIVLGTSWNELLDEDHHDTPELDEWE